jgi:DNA repair protein RadC
LAAEAPQKSSEACPDPAGKLVELGPHTLKQAELLAILIGSGVPGRSALAIANAILDEYVGIFGIHRQKATVEDLTRITGLGRNKAMRILAAVELGRRLHRRLRALPRRLPYEPEEDLLSLLERSPEPAPLPPDEPDDAELLGAIISSGIPGRSPRVIAADLLARFGSFLGLFGQDMGDFLAVKGLNSTRIIRIAAAIEVAKRISQALS